MKYTRRAPDRPHCAPRHTVREGHAQTAEDPRARRTTTLPNTFAVDARAVLSIVIVEARKAVLELQMEGRMQHVEHTAATTFLKCKNTDPAHNAVVASLLTHHHEILAFLALCDNRFGIVEVELRNWLAAQAASDVNEPALALFLQQTYARSNVSSGPPADPAQRPAHWPENPEMPFERCLMRREDCPCLFAPVGLIALCAGLKTQTRRALNGGHVRFLPQGPLALLYPRLPPAATERPPSEHSLPNLVRDAAIVASDATSVRTVRVAADQDGQSFIARDLNLLYAAWVHHTSAKDMLEWAATVDARIEHAPDDACCTYMLAIECTFDSRIPLLL